MLFFKGQDVTDGIIFQSEGLNSACTDVHGGGGLTQTTELPTKDYLQNISCSHFQVPDSTNE